MKVIIAGSRNINNIELIKKAVVEAQIHTQNISEIVSGGARGVDLMGEYYAKEHNIKVVKFPADWDTYGKSAGYRRNYEMGVYSDMLLAVWDGKSKGTKHMIDIMNKLNKAIFVLVVEGV